MSKIVDRIITIPKEVGLKYDEKIRKLSVEGPNGFFALTIHPFVSLSIENGELKTNYFSNNKQAKALTGTMNSLIFSAINGSINDYKKVLEIRGVGYRASTSGDKMTVSAGYSHDVYLDVPKDLKVECSSNGKITVKGGDKQKVGWFASKIRDIRRPNAFVKSLKGIFYEEEVSTFKPKAGKRDSKK